jgi:hypothetical protein
VSTAAADAARQRVLTLLTTQLPDLDVQAAEQALEAANAAGHALWDVDAHLAAHPDALVTGSPDIPPSMFRLLVVLETAGHPVHVPPCASCGQRKPLPQRIPAGRVCVNCRSKAVPPHPCTRCGQRKQVVAQWPMGPVCRRCYREVRGNPATCAGCDATKPLIGVDGRGRGVCGACAGGRFDYVCRRCGGGEERYQDGNCVRCVAIERLHEQFRGPTGQVPDVLMPLLAALAQADRPRSVLEWLRRDDGGAQVLRQLGAAGVEPTHEVLDSLPSTGVNALRQMLVHVGALPARIEYLERVPAWLNRQLQLHPEHHRQVIHVYVTWTVLRRARQRAAHARFTEASAHNLRGRVRAALAFLRWLDERHVALADVTQALVDQWLSEGACTRRVVKDFLDWAAGRGLAPELDVRYLPPSEPDLSVTNEERWEQLRRCLRDATLPLEARAAGGLVLLYGLPVSRISELTAEHLISGDTGHVLQLGGHRTALPPPLAALLTDLARTAVTTSTVGRSVPGPRWLFPGGLPGQHFTPGRLANMLNRHGIRVRVGRNSALAALAADIPAAALSPLLGISIEAAVRWTRRAKRGWQTYIQARATATTAPLRGRERGAPAGQSGLAGSNRRPESTCQVQGPEPLITPDPA